MDQQGRTQGMGLAVLEDEAAALAVAGGAYPGPGGMPLDCGHLVAEEAPEACAAALLGFFRESTPN